jgi:hypothetical protein
VYSTCNSGISSICMSIHEEVSKMTIPIGPNTCERLPHFGTKGDGYDTIISRLIKCLEETLG